jgi:hypothetical protein
VPEVNKANADEDFHRLQPEEKNEEGRHPNKAAGWRRKREVAEGKGNSAAGYCRAS